MRVATYLYLVLSPLQQNLKSVLDFGALKECLVHIVLALTTIFSQQW